MGKKRGNVICSAEIHGIGGYCASEWLEGSRLSEMRGLGGGLEGCEQACPLPEAQSLLHGCFFRVAQGNLGKCSCCRLSVGLETSWRDWQDCGRSFWVTVEWRPSWQAAFWFPQGVIFSLSLGYPHRVLPYSCLSRLVWSDICGVLRHWAVPEQVPVGRAPPLSSRSSCQVSKSRRWFVFSLLFF